MTLTCMLSPTANEMESTFDVVSVFNVQCNIVVSMNTVEHESKGCYDNKVLITGIKIDINIPVSIPFLRVLTIATLWNVRNHAYINS